MDNHVSAERSREGSDELLELLRLHHPEYTPIQPKKVELKPEPVAAAPEPKVVPLPVALPEPTESDPLPSISLIISETAKFYNIEKVDFVSARRTRAIARPRQVAMYLAKTMTLRSLPEIGRRFGDRDHTTILHGVRKTTARLLSEDRLQDEIEVLKLRIREAVLNQVSVASRINSGDTSCNSAQTTAI